MYSQCNPNEMPGVGNTVLNVNRAVWLGRAQAGVQYLPGGGRIDGNNARDPDNSVSSTATPVLPGATNVVYTGTLRAGLLLGKITASGLYGASILGVTTTVVTASNSTTFRVSVACGTEIVRRLGGVSGSLKLTGPASTSTAAASQNTDVITVSNVVIGASYATVTIAETTHTFIAGSLVQPDDGSETVQTFIDELDGMRVVDVNGNGITVQFPRVPVAGGMVNVASLINYPSALAGASVADVGLQLYIKAALRAAMGGITFSDDFGN